MLPLRGINRTISFKPPTNHIVHFICRTAFPWAGKSQHANNHQISLMAIRIA